MESLPDHVRILDLSQVLAGPYCTMLLADLGYEIIKIEEPGKGDLSRRIGPYFIDGVSTYFISINRNKKGVTLNLKTHEGREILYRLVEKSDVVVDNFRPSVSERLKCNYDNLKEINPRIICCSITGFGSNGPCRDLPSNDLVVQAMGGGMSLTGHPNQPPVRMGIPIGDLACGLFAAFAISSALFRRERTGRGEYIDLSMLDCQVSLLTYIAQSVLVSGEVPEPVGSGHQWYVPYQVFATRDSYIVIAAFSDKFWQKLCIALDTPDYAGDPRFATEAKRKENKAILIPLLEQIIADRDSAELVERLWEHGVTAGPLNNVAQVLGDTQILARDMIVQMPWLGGSTLRTVGSPIKSSALPEPKLSRPANLGEHTAEVLTSLLGYSTEDVERLRKLNVI